MLWCPVFVQAEWDQFEEAAQKLQKNSRGRRGLKKGAVGQRSRPRQEVGAIFLDIFPTPGKCAHHSCGQPRTLISCLPVPAFMSAGHAPCNVSSPTIIHPRQAARPALLSLPSSIVFSPVRRKKQGTLP